MSVFGAGGDHHSGANMPDGLVAALSTDQTAPLAVLEIDENYSEGVGRDQPAVIVLLNLSRDQMDGSARSATPNANLRAAIAKLRDTMIVANCDDVLVTSRPSTADPRPVGTRRRQWRGDSTSCPRCGIGTHQHHRRRTTDWYCDCGSAEPHADLGGHDGLHDHACR